MDGFVQDYLKKRIQKKVWKSLPTWKKALIIGTVAVAVDGVFFNGNVILRRTKRIK